MSDPAKSGVISTPAVPRETSQVLLPAEPQLTMTPEQYDAFARTFRSDTEHAVRMVDPLPIASDEKHAMVRDAIVSVGVAKLQGSVRELRGVPPEVLELAANTLIALTVRLIRRATGG